MDRDQGQPGPADEGTGDGGLHDGGTHDGGAPDRGTPTEAQRPEDSTAPASDGVPETATEGMPQAPEAAQTEPLPGDGFAAPGGFAGGPSLPYQTGQLPPVPQYNPYAQVPGAPVPNQGGTSGYPSQGGNPGYPSYQGQPSQQGQQGQQGQQAPQGNPGYPSYQGQQGPYANQGANMGYPGQQGPPSHPGYPNQPGYGSYGPPPSTPGKGLAIAALVLAILALLVCWIPFLNVVAFPLAIVAVGLGIPALLKGIKARNISKPLSIAALSVAAVSIIAAIVVNTVVVDSLKDAGLWESEVGTETFTEIEDYSDELSEAEKEDFSYQYSDSYISEIVAEPANAAGDEVTVGDYTVTLVELDRDAAAEVQERDPAAGAPDYNYVIARFSAVYNGTGDGRPWLDLPPELIGTDSRIYTVMGCSSSLGQRTVDQDLLSKGDTVTVEGCFDVPDSALGEDARLGMRMILAEENNDNVYWRLP